MPKTFSGKALIKILSRKFDFYFVSQKGSHVKLRRKIGGKTFTTVVPLHRDLAPGTFRSVLKLGGLEEDEFWKVVEK
ncbi:hypothetical protein A2662_00840 [Candidatus Giovannonibacteria bacterium RIFCSPHIGHO2_01_FULL_45_33]|uniref:Addiction module toxin, HicA family n=1 Tax=Candidatus Giovannonibacteria bacterium RIFCSPLOWO2_01_FULL_45_34 TaxID=1798351 RepID=A0A1F5WY01_9BACT|nr:MAG: hypothetical protein A2662_00840 [Candidatus Giovannonibacteria bacterium RIFCSPHIGHO2_01_FULL_45_33]OGF70860.1 MAG: hypothetical protein A3C73_02165 [Candidatus Giovannonibacteria bacterium RIFCSPHIGHO2_02_FULL_44_11]OGF80522.1 MAG: hypothetical protein A2930_02735 [Candidatus Giovannonibacteria bacterium RIFCSPLOWO2_01_FULL_45_34]